MCPTQSVSRVPLAPLLYVLWRNDIEKVLALDLKPCHDLGSNTGIDFLKIYSYIDLIPQLILAPFSHWDPCGVYHLPIEHPKGLGCKGMSTFIYSHLFPMMYTGKTSWRTLDRGLWTALISNIDSTIFESRVCLASRCLCQWKPGLLPRSKPTWAPGLFG